MEYITRVALIFVIVLPCQTVTSLYSLTTHYTVFYSLFFKLSIRHTNKSRLFGWPFVQCTKNNANTYKTISKFDGHVQVPPCL